jgi:hypothetical protein
MRESPETFGREIEALGDGRFDGLDVDKKVILEDHERLLRTREEPF